MEIAEVSFEWAAGDSQTGRIRDELRAIGARVDSVNRPFVPPPRELAAYTRASFEPLTVIAGVMGLLLLAERVAAFVKDLTHDGLIVDVRHDPISIRPHPALDRGILLVVTADGAQQFDSARRPDLAALIASYRK